jgi:hypothetical protein
MPPTPSSKSTRAAEREKTGYPTLSSPRSRLSGVSPIHALATISAVEAARRLFMPSSKFPCVGAEGQQGPVPPAGHSATHRHQHIGRGWGARAGPGDGLRILPRHRIRLHHAADQG